MMGANRKLAQVVLAAVVFVGLMSGVAFAGCTTVGGNSYEDVVVDDAGTPEANGTYVFYDMWEGKPEYRIDNNMNRAVYWNEFGDFWAIATVNYGAYTYTCASSADTPPSSGWVAEGGAAPAPTPSGGQDCSATPGITVTPTSGLTTTEAGPGSDTFTVVLDTLPTASVTIGISSSNTTEGTVSPASLTFTTGNWSSAQTVTVTGVDDPVDDGNIGYYIETAAATSGDGDYDGMNAADVGVTNVDDDTKGISVSTISGHTSEAGGTATFTVVLNTNPTDDVTIGISSNDVTEGTASPDSLTFTTTNWSSAQTVTVTGVNDDVDDGDVAYQINTAPATGGDYAGLDATDVSVTNDDDDTRGITVFPVSGPILTTTEAGGADTFTVVLASEPTASVSIDMSSSDTSEGTVSPASLTFTASNWDSAQTVTVTGVDDNVDDDDVAYFVDTAAATGGDYAGINPNDVPVLNTDDDTRGITVLVGEDLITTEAGGTDTFGVVLDTEPTASVTIGISSDDITEGTVSPASLTFTTTNWATPQTVTVTGVDDAIFDGDVAYNIITAPATGGDYGSLNAADVAVTNEDDDVPGITVSGVSGPALNTTEAGGADALTVVLRTEPTASVTIGISSDDITEGTVSPDSLTFTTTNWATPQTVTVTGVDDDVDDGDVLYNVVTAAAVSADGDYSGMNASDVSVTNEDDDAAGITVSAVSGNTTEAGGAATFTVVLDTQPTASVSMGISSSDITEGTVSPASLTFTTGNWSSAQTVTVTGVDDDVDDGDVVYTIVTAPAVSGDGDYSDMNADDVTVTNADDDTRGITVSPIFGLVTTEAGGTATFTVVLDTEPTGSVAIGISSDDTTEGTVSPASLTFSAANWATAQTVTVTGVDDDVDDGDVGYLILTAVATGGDYDGLDPNDVDVTNTDDDTAGITVTPTSGLITTEAGGTAAFTVVLHSEPTGFVDIGLSSNDSSEGTVSPGSLDFTAANWNVPQTVTVTGVDDSHADGDRGYTILTAPAVSTDFPYDSVDPPDVSVTNVDDDIPGITVTPTSGLRTTEAGGTATFTVVLDTRPMLFIDFNISSDDTSEGTVSPTSLCFNDHDWDIPQTVTVTGVDDDIDDGDVGFTIVTHPAFSMFPDYDGLDAADVRVTNADDDVPPPPDLVVLPAGAAGEDSILDRVLPLEEGEEPPIVGGQRLYAIYEVGEPITGELMLTDGSGKPIRNSFVIVELYCLDLSCVPHTCVRVVNSMIRYDRDYRTYRFSIDTADCSPGYYDFLIAFSDGTDQKHRIQLIAPTP